ncbi:hypothetical protein ACLMJK_004132 [Lecanora helva]
MQKLFQLQDRKDAKYILSPTHEEEITTLIGSIVHSYKEFPLRLYQIRPETNRLARKYRDEPRPRQGLLRTREFLMKDLYTFDIGIRDALNTYEIVRQVYTAFFNEFKVPYVVAEASSGEIGGDLSHEYHITSAKGEDRLISCDSCDYVANEELARSETNMTTWPEDASSETPKQDWVGITKDRSTLAIVVFPSNVAIKSPAGDSWRRASPNLRKIKSLVPELDISVESPITEFKESLKSNPQHKILLIHDKRLQRRTSPNMKNLSAADVVEVVDGDLLAGKCGEIVESSGEDLIQIDTGDACAVCENGTLRAQTSVELGHTFHLGTRYTEPLGATVARDSCKDRPSGLVITNPPPDTQPYQIPVQMGCHGIGVSRLIAAMSDALVDSKGLNWPRVMAPFEVILVPIKSQEAEATKIYDLLATSGLGAADGQHGFDTILDDRDKNFGWKLRDADTIGYPVIVVIGRNWTTKGKVEVQCRRLGIKEDVAADTLKGFVANLLEQL